jgi:uncharacterized membrane protein YheB (UPF0754 family)
MKIELTQEQIRDVLKALYTEKLEIIERKQLRGSIAQNDDAEYVRNQNLRVLFETAKRGY